MPLSGKLIADFESFYTAAQKADGDLRRLESGAEKVGTSFNRMTGSGTSGFTTFHQGLSQADKVLAAFGVRIGPEIQAIKELGEASGKTASQIGLIGTAGLVVGAGLAGWKVGRMIADYFDLDKTISNTVATLMGWGDVVAVTAAAKADVLAKASSIAGREITNLTEAMKINAGEAKRLGEAQEAAAKAAEAAWQKGKAEYAKWEEELQAFQDKLSGQAAIDRAFEYADAIMDLKDQGLEPMKAIWPEIAKAAEAALTVMRERGKGVGQEFEQMLATFNKFAGRTSAGAIPSRGIPGLETAVPAAISTDESIVSVRRMAEEEIALAEAQAAWNKEMGDGLVLIGGVRDVTTAAAAASVASTQQMADGWKLVGTEAKMAATNIQLAVPQGTSYTEAYRKAGLFVHDISPSSVTSKGKGAGPGWGMPAMNVTFNDAFIDTPAGAQRTAERVGQAVVNQLKGQGTSLG